MSDGWICLPCQAGAHPHSIDPTTGADIGCEQGQINKPPAIDNQCTCPVRTPVEACTWCDRAYSGLR